MRRDYERIGKYLARGCVWIASGPLTTSSRGFFACRSPLVALEPRSCRHALTHTC
jgi:hypothetical protein